MKELTQSSTLKELYSTPIGHDTIGRVLLQLNLSEKWITGSLIGNLKLKTLMKLTKKSLGEGFWNALLHLINQEKDLPLDRTPEAMPKEPKKTWWKEAVIYQIYPRSFADSNGDGIGDLKGITEKLDYLKDLGVNAIWLSPVYDSPNDDNGYDIRDYRKIMTEFGTMEDFDELLKKTHEKGMRLIMDLVVNHTSDEHEWFRKALSDPDSKYRDYYFFREDTGKEPNNWVSFFGGTAWNRYPEQNAWALHLFSKKQMDLNWDNPNVREDVIDMINWWLDKGVDGFRMDVINYISKEAGLPDGDEAIGSMMMFYGIEHYYYGPHLHEYLKEIQDKAFRPHGAFSVGETPGVGREMAKLITGEERGELDMIFSFDQLDMPGRVRFDYYEYDLNYYRDYIIDWMEHYGNNCWMSLFYNNHDNPRMVSKVTKDPAFNVPVEKLLAVMQFTLKGTPFVYQGDEMGLTNYDFHSIEELSDVESKNRYQELLEMHAPEEAFRIIRTGTRDHTRVLLPWNETAKNLPDHLTQSPDESITDFYRDLIRLRREHPALIYGTFKVLSRKKNRFVYERSDGSENFVIECNLSKDARPASFRPDGYEPVLDPKGAGPVLAPYEARIYRKKTEA